MRVLRALTAVVKPTTPKQWPPSWLLGQIVRAAYLTGVAAGTTDATVDELESLLHVTLGETAAMPMVRAADLNRPIGGRRYADTGAWQMSLAWWANQLPLSEPGRRIGALLIIAEQMDPRKQAPVALKHVRRGTAFHSEQAVRDGVGSDGAIKRRVADLIMVEVRKIDAAARAPVGAISVAPL